MAIVLAGFLGTAVGMRLHDGFFADAQSTASLVAIVVPSTAFATCACAVVSRVGSVILILGGLQIAGASLTVCLLAHQAPLALSPLAILATERAESAHSEALRPNCPDRGRHAGFSFL
jgi:hypothetical protein